MSVHSLTSRPLTPSLAPTPLHFPVPENVLSLTRVMNGFRLLYVVLAVDNPLLWSYRHGARNTQADLEGPYYLIGAPDRTIAPGKAILASLDELKSMFPSIFSY